MVGRQARDARQRGQGHALFRRALLDVRANAAHQERVRMGGHVARPAPEAGAEARVLGGGRVGEEDDLAPSRLSRGARRAAVDPRGSDAEDEASVLASVAAEDRQPTRVAGSRGGIRRGC